VTHAALQSNYWPIIFCHE